MHFILCLDDRNGMLFNNRRLSSDAVVCQRVFEQHAGSLWMDRCSAKLFADMEVCADEAFLQKAAAGDTCFVESLDFIGHLPQASSITVYRWNRHYPSDVKLPAQLLADWKLCKKTDFPGNSHETITEEVYTR